MTTTLMRSQQQQQPSTRKKTKHYVNNKDFLNALIDYKAKLTVSKETGSEIPAIPQYIGECIFNIATRLSHKPNFINYPFRNEMISDGIENCFIYMNNFDPTKTNNPFAYFTQIIKFAFIRRIQREKKQLYIRHKISELQLYSNTRKIDENESELMDDFVEQYEAMLETKREKARSRTTKKTVE